MQLNEVLYSRRSIRSYTGEGITDAQLAEILKAAYASPVGRGMYETLQLTVVTDPAILSEIDGISGEPGRHLLYGAPLLIIVSSSEVKGLPTDNLAYSNGAIIVHNMALKAVELGIGHCDIWGAMMATVAKQPEYLAKLNLPEGHTPLCSIILGGTEEAYTEREIPERIKTVYVK